MEQRLSARPVAGAKDRLKVCGRDISRGNKAAEAMMRRRAQSTTTGAINRRTLFRYGAAGGVLAVMRPAIGRAAAVPAPEASKADPFALEEATIADLQKKMASGEESSRSLTQTYLARIEALDKKGPELRSVLETNPDA